MFCVLLDVCSSEWEKRLLYNLPSSLRSILLCGSVFLITSDNLSNADNVTPRWDISTAASLKLYDKLYQSKKHQQRISVFDATYFPHYLNRLKTNTGNKTISYTDCLLNGPGCNAVTRFPVFWAREPASHLLPRGLLFSSTTRLTHRWCKVFAPRPLGIVSGYSGNRRKITAAEANKARDSTRALNPESLTLRLTR